MRTLRDVANPSTTTELELAKSYILLANVARTAGVRELVAAIEATGGLDLALTARPRLTPREGDWGGRPPPPQSTLQYLEDASRILKKQIAANPSDAELRLLLAKCELDLSDYTHLFAQALALPIELKSSENAERIVRQLVQEESSSLHRQFELAEMLIARTRIEGELNEDSAIAHLREATAICEKLVATVPRNPEFRVLLGRSKHLMAVRLKEMGELQESSIAMQEALEIYRELSEESPTSSFFQISRAQLLLEWAIWQEEQGDSVGGRATLQKSLEVAQKAAPAWGNTGIFADFLAKLKQKVAGANR